MRYVRAKTITKTLNLHYQKSKGFLGMLGNRTDVSEFATKLTRISVISDISENISITNIEKFKLKRCLKSVL